MSYSCKKIEQKKNKGLIKFFEPKACVVAYVSENSDTIWPRYAVFRAALRQR